MSKHGMDADAYCLQLEKTFKRKRTAFSGTTLAVLYSGPMESIIKAVPPGTLNNWQRSKQVADRLKGSRIDEVWAGRSLNQRDLWAYFKPTYKTDAATSDAILRVWGRVSELFVQAANFSQAATVVCGAAPDRVFRRFELAAAVKNPRLETANNRPMQMVRDFHGIAPYEAFRLLCLTELVEARTHAQKTNTPEAWQDYRERRTFYMMEHNDTLRRSPAKPAASAAVTKALKRQILADYRIARAAGSASSSVIVLPPVRGPHPYSHRAGHGRSHSAAYL